MRPDQPQVLRRVKNHRTEVVTRIHPVTGREASETRHVYYRDEIDPSMPIAEGLSDALETAYDNGTIVRRGPGIFSLPGDSRFFSRWKKGEQE